MHDLTGKRFGRLTAIRPTGQTGDWVCKCSCGELVTVPETYLVSGVRTNCGCTRTRAIDLAGQRFGYLTAVHPVQERAVDNSVRWVCRCDCGKHVTVSSNQLRMGSTKSCGCQTAAMIKAGRKLIDGTCVEIMLSEKLRINNTSGRTGVARRGQGWQAYITYGGKRRFLGSFPTIGQAITAREKAEKEVRTRLEQFMNGTNG